MPVDAESLAKDTDVDRLTHSHTGQHLASPYRSAFEAVIEPAVLRGIYTVVREQGDWIRCAHGQEVG